MKETIKVWQDKRYKVELEDVRRNLYEGIIIESDDTGVVLRIDKNNDNLVLIPWTAICFIKRK